MELPVIKELRQEVASTGQSELARQMGVSPQLICDVLAGRRTIGIKILDHLGWKRVVTYVRKRG